MPSRIEMAAAFARAAHQAVGQKHKYTNTPYWHHLTAVAATVRMYTDNPEMIAAAYLHDVLEDTQVTSLDLSQTFGERVAVLVFELTDQFITPHDGNRAQRKAKERDRLAKVSAEAQTIKYADLIDNTASIVEHDPGFASVYLKEKRALLEVMNQGDQKLWRKAWGLLVEGEAKIARHFKEKRAEIHKVYINGWHVRTVFSAEEAWKVIDAQPFGSGHSVTDADDKIRPDFIPY